MTKQSRKKKALRRGHNEGSIQETKSGTWRAWVTMSSGKRISKTHPTKTEARKWMQQKLTEEEQPPESELTFGEYILDWFENHCSQIKESTQSDYRIIIHKYILPELGDLVLGMLRRSVFDTYYTELRKIPVGDTQIRYIHRIIHKALQDAVNDRMLSYNPSDGAKAPKKPKAKRINCPLNEEQCDVLLSTAMQNSIGPLIYLAIKTGMRQGELFALKWEDINWQTQQIHIQRNVQRVLRDGKRGRVFSTPKSASSNRVIVIGEKTIEVLRFQQREAEQRRILAKRQWRENDLVFPSTIGTPLSQSNITKQFADTLKEAGLPHVRFHDLRHIAASIMLNHGIPLLTVSYLLGHAQPSTTLNMYGHQFSAMEVQAACLMDDIFAKSQPSLIPAELFSPSNLKK
jgi:integrase